MLKIDRKTGLIATDDGNVVFDPRLRPKMIEWPRPLSVTKLFEGFAEDETKILIFPKGGLWRFSPTVCSRSSEVRNERRELRLSAKY
jgi:hypothetical protein